MKNKFFIFLALKDILEIFAEQEIGTNCEIDVPKALEYISSFKFAIDTFTIKTKEEIYESITNDILNGYPIWQLLDIPEWTKNMLEREFAIKQAKIREKLIKTYKCYTCKYFKESETSIGVYRKCTYTPPSKHPFREFHRMYREGAFEPKNLVLIMKKFKRFL